ncbi:unnamed protein product [Knipowitschia caucasica]|uniref:TLC domain-containing protein n=1 Tax=Knipowitschia caucasica TaxID=637954 RepID=A0AAV2J1P9_KNICA
MLLSALACGVVVFPGLFFSSRAVLRRLFPNWSEADVVSISERVVSAVHGSLATAAGAIVVLSCQDVMNDNHWLVNTFVVFGAPYMAFDIYSMYLSHFHSQNSSRHSLQTLKAFLHKDWMLVLHHVTLLTVFMPVALFLRRGLGDFFIGCFFTTEFSSPFIAIGKILIQRRLDDTWLHRLNGLVVLLTFFTCRILIFPFMYWTYGRQFGIPLNKVPFHLPLHCNLGNAVILAPQVYWFILLVKKAKRLYLRGKKGKET